MTVRAWVVASIVAGASTGVAAASDGGAPATPVRFERNDGQTDPRVRFVSRDPHFTLFLTDDAFVMALAGDNGRRSSVRITFEGARRSPRIEGAGNAIGTTSYLRGHDPAAWRTGIAGYPSVRYTAVYRGVDLVLYGRERQVEYDFVVAPRVNPAVIRLHVDGGTPSIEEGGDLRIATASGTVTLSRPNIYQDAPDGRHRIDGGYVRLAKRDIGFRIGRYDRSLPLVIDPVLAYSTYLGGSDWDFASDLRADSAGNAYVCGYTASLDFPTTIGQTVSGGSYDAFVAKVRPNGTLAWATYLGGSGFENCQTLAVDSEGFVYAAGGTTSADFPVVGGARAALNGNDDGFLAKLDPAGSQILYSSYLGGSGSDGIAALTIDPFGAAYVAGTTTSTDFPLVNAARPQYGGGVFDGFVAKVTPAGDALQFSSYMGGSDVDEPSAIALSPGGEVYVGGMTMSSDFPVVAPMQAQYHGLFDGFLFKLSADGSTVLYATYLGTSGWDSVLDLKALDDQTLLVAGYAGFGFPVTPGVFGPFVHGSRDAFVSRLSADGQQFIFSTYFGGNHDDGATRVDVDPAGHVWIVGSTDSTDLPMRNPLQGTYGDDGCCQDAFVAELSADAKQLLFSTFLGGTDIDSGTGLGIDGLGNVYVGGQTASLNFPTVEPIIAAPAGPRDAFLARIVVNRAPTANAGPDQQVNADGACRASVTLDGRGSSDPDGDPLSYAWSGGFGSATGVTPTISASVGTETIVLTVSDGNGGAASDAVQIAVNNTVPPIIDQLTATPSTLTPPDHRIVDVTIAALAAPACGTTATCQIVSVSSNETANGTGDGNTSTDWVITGLLTLQLRAERSGTGSGRIYTIVVRCTDSAGNSSTKNVTVTVS
jgi:PKD domain/Beta-propeller repeat